MPDDKQLSLDEINRLAYDEIAEEYYQANFNSNIGDILESIPAITNSTLILDLGCGPGNNIRLFIQFNPQLVVGIDMSKGMIDKAREALGEQANVLLQQTVFKEYQPDRFFDLIIANLSFVHVEPSELSHILAIVRSCITDTGTFFANYFEGENITKLMESKWGKKKGIKRNFSFHSEELLRKAYEEAGLEIVSINKVQPSPNAFVRINILAKKK